LSANEYMGPDAVLLGLCADLPCKLASGAEVGHTLVKGLSTPLAKKKANQSLACSGRQFDGYVARSAKLLMIGPKHIGLV
jgi:hypothetical protein